MKAEIHVQGKGEKPEFFRTEVGEGVSPIQAATEFMRSGAFDNSRRDRGRIDYYPPSQIIRIEFTEIES